MPLVEITGVGAFVRPEGHDRLRPKVKGDRVNVSDEDARRLIANGAAVPVQAETTAADAAIEAEALPDLQGMTVPELRSFASDRRIRLGGARTRPEVLGAIQAALADELTTRGVPGEGGVIADAAAADPGAISTEGADLAAPPAPPADIGQGAPVDPDTLPESDPDAGS